MSRPSALDRKEDYLDIGMEILTQFTPEQAAAATSDALAHVLVSEVAARAGVTKGSVYHVWGSQEAYRRDLLERILDRSTSAWTQDIAHLVKAGQNSDGNPVDLLLDACDAAFDIAKNDPKFFVRFSFYLYATNPEVNELLSRGDKMLLEHFGGALELYLSLLGRRVREPFSIEMIVTAASSLLMGLTLRYRTSPEAVDGYRDGDPTRHSRFATGLEAIVLHFSEPLPET